MTHLMNGAFRPFVNRPEGDFVGFHAALTLVCMLSAADALVEASGFLSMRTGTAT